MYVTIFCKFDPNSLQTKTYVEVPVLQNSVVVVAQHILENIQFCCHKLGHKTSQCVVKNVQFHSY